MPSRMTTERILDFASRIEGIDLDLLREGLEVISLHRRVEQVVEDDLADWGLTARQVEIMETLYHYAKGTLTPADLSDEVGLTRSAMTSALDSLEKLGHVVRKRHPTDRRMLAISLTPSGRTFIEGRLPERYQRICEVQDCLSKAERDSLLRSFVKVLDFLSADTAKRRTRTLGRAATVPGPK
jgi:MarR family transcriptional regulator, negative regulator of the multidrug operon emrRAB